MEEAEACTWCWKGPCQPDTRSLVLSHREAPTQLGRTAQCWAAWEPEPQAKEQACAVHKVTARPDTPWGCAHARDREEHTLTCPPPPPPPGACVLGLDPALVGAVAMG